jgi:hypothetical protein
MNKLFAAAIVGGIALVSSVSAVSAQTSAAPAPATQAAAASDLAHLFPSLVAEARSKTPAASERGTINTSLATAEWYWASGDQAKAVSYLNFARGRLGLRLVPLDSATRQAGRTP